MGNSNLPPADALPKHVGIIMDGNGRWAKKRNLPRREGHKAGAKVFRTISDYACEIGVEYITFYAFSTENWKRPPEEVSALIGLFREYLTEADEIKEEKEKKGIYLRFIGDTGGIPEDLVNLMDSTSLDIKKPKYTIVNIALNYGGRLDILNSVRELAQSVKNGEINPEDITEADISRGLYTKGMPDLDLIIRPSGEYRLSNFMIWQAAYAEFWFSDILWPDFTTDDFNRALMDYAHRTRRFGGV